MFGIGSTELAIILVFGFLLFGPDKLPQMGRTIGRALRQFRETQEKLTSVVQSEVVDPMTAAVNEPTRPRRVDDDDDTDASAEEAEAPARKETFAERRARLAAEKAAAEQTAQEGDAGEKDAAVADVAATTSEPAPAGDATDTASDIAAADTEAESEDRAMADLYARRPRKRKVEAEQADAQDAEASAQPDDAVEGGDR